MRKIFTLLLVASSAFAFAQSDVTGISIYFDKADFTVSAENNNLIQQFIRANAQSDYNSILIKGYADADGNATDNMELSQQRVDAVRRCVSGNAYAVETMFFGENDPLNNNSNDDEKALNRRVDVVMWTSYSLNTLKKPAQTFSFTANRDVQFTAAEGTTIYIPAGGLVYTGTGKVPIGKIDVSITEYYSMADIVQNKLTTTSGEQMIESAGMINITATSNGNPLRLKGGTLMEVGFADRKADDGFGLFYSNSPANNAPVNWVPAVDAKAVSGWKVSGAKLWEADTVKKWRSKFQFNKYGQQIRVTENWEEGKEIWYDTLVMDKTINMNSMILQATQMGWINCDRFVEDEQPVVMYVQTDKATDAEVVLIFKDRKALLEGRSMGEGKYMFNNVPKDEDVTIVAVAKAGGLMLFSAMDSNTGIQYNNVKLKPTGIDQIVERLSI
ncbi:MAG: OmpA family protein [Chitinophagales bacterium]